MIQDVTAFSTEVLNALSDEDILRLSRSEPGAFRVLVKRYEDAFLRKARSILVSPEDAEEVVQDAFTRIYLYADRYAVQEGASFSSWAYTILTRLAFTRYQKLRKLNRVSAALDPEVFERLPDKGDFVEDLSVRNEVLMVLAKLPEAMSRALRLQFLEGKTQEEIASAEGSTVSAIKTRVHRAKKLFKDTYDEQR